MTSDPCCGCLVRRAQARDHHRLRRHHRHQNRSRSRRRRRRRRPLRRRHHHRTRHRRCRIRHHPKNRPNHRTRRHHRPCRHPTHHRFRHRHCPSRRSRRNHRSRGLFRRWFHIRCPGPRPGARATHGNDWLAWMVVHDSTPLYNKRYIYPMADQMSFSRCPYCARRSGHVAQSSHQTEANNRDLTLSLAPNNQLFPCTINRKIR